MSDAAIRAALEAAVSRKRYTIATLEDELADTAAAIAAFLRALPYVYRSLGQSADDFRAENESLAAAVEAAAKGER